MTAGWVSVPAVYSILPRDPLSGTDQPRRVSDKGTDEVKVGREQAQVEAASSLSFNLRSSTRFTRSFTRFTTRGEPKVTREETSEESETGRRLTRDQGNRGDKGNVERIRR